MTHPPPMRGARLPDPAVPGLAVPLQDPPLRVVLYEVVSPRTPTHHTELARLAELGLPTSGDLEQVSGVDGILQACARWEAGRGDLAFDVDGLASRPSDPLRVESEGYALEGRAVEGAVALTWRARAGS